MPTAPFSDVEIALKARRRLERPLLLTIWISGIMLSLAEGNVFYLLAISFAVVINLVAVQRASEIFVRRVFVNIGVLLSTVVLAVELWDASFSLPAALGHYIILIQACKLFEHKSNRDYVQLLVLSVLTVVAAALFSQALWFAALFVAHLTLAAYCAMVLTLKRGLDASAEARLASDTLPIPAQRIAWNVIRDWPGKALARRLAVSLAAMFALGAIVFVLAPRVEMSPGRGFMGSARSAGSGYVGEVKLGQPKQIYLSAQTVMRMTVRKEGHGGFFGPLYLRGKTFEGYRQSSWVDLSGGAFMVSTDLNDEILAGAMVQEVTLDPKLLPQVFAVSLLVRLESPDGLGYIDSRLQGRLSSSVLPNRPVHYTAYSLPGPLNQAQQDYLNAFQNNRSGDPNKTVDPLPEVRALALQWCKDLPNVETTQPSNRDEADLAIAQRIAQKLRSEYAYTLDLTSAQAGRDGVEDFLLHMRRGNCEYFASAMTVMCRLLDVRARLVTGFLADEFDTKGGYYIVREHDAHAWTEVFTPSSGWVTFDATSGNRWVPRREGVLAGIEDFWGRVQFYWYNRVVGYNATVQRELGEQVAEQVVLFARAMEKSMHAAREGVINLLVRGVVDTAMVQLSILIGSVAVVVEFLLILRWRRRALQRRAEQALLAAQPWGELTFVSQLLAVLAAHGLPARDDQTVRELAAEASKKLNLPARMLMELTALYYRARWGGVRPDPPAIATARVQTEQLRQLLAEKAAPRG
ncbi:MAG: transglutaminaseTgpA domain-containing protein [Phycisphaerae bacterium]|jgi:hypothetical protein